MGNERDGEFFDSLMDIVESQNLCIGFRSDFLVRLLSVENLSTGLRVSTLKIFRV